jgi:hypothetical protein
MSHLLEIPDSLYAALKAAATASGLSPVERITVHLPQTQSDAGTTVAQAATPATMADLFTGRVGHIRSGGQKPLSQESGEQFADYLEEKRRAGHL